jgi:hypothetical protein
MGRGRLSLVAVLAAAVIGALVTSSAQATVSISQRNAVVFVADLSTGFSGPEKTFYQGVEKAAYLSAVTILSPVYHSVFKVEGADATQVALRNAVSAATSGSTITAVDLIFVTHGLDHGVVFANNTIVPIDTVRDDLLAHLSAAQRQKLRIVFSTACFGASQRAGWIGAGFKAADGSLGVYSDSASSYVPFLGAWALGQSFGGAVTVANLADPFHFWDGVANATFLSGTPFAGQANSTRVVSGNSALTIDGNPVGTFKLAPPNATARPGKTVTYNFSWIVPKPRRWKSLKSVDLRLADAKGTVAIALGWNPTTDTLTLENAARRPTSGPRQPGERGSLRGVLAALSLRGSSVAARGRTVRFTLPLTPLRKAAGHTYRVEVAASDASGRRTPWNVAGVLTVPK